MVTHPSIPHTQVSSSGQWHRDSQLWELSDSSASTHALGKMKTPALERGEKQNFPGKKMWPRVAQTALDKGKPAWSHSLAARAAGCWLHLRRREISPVTVANIIQTADSLCTVFYRRCSLVLLPSVPIPLPCWEQKLISRIFTLTLQPCHTSLTQLLETLMPSLPLFPIHTSLIPPPTFPSTVVLAPVQILRGEKIKMRLKRLQEKNRRPKKEFSSRRKRKKGEQTSKPCW